jgi:hypothetical protein
MDFTPYADVFSLLVINPRRKIFSLGIENYGGWPTSEQVQRNKKNTSTLYQFNGYFSYQTSIR